MSGRRSSVGGVCAAGFADIMMRINGTGSDVQTDLGTDVCVPQPQSVQQSPLSTPLAAGPLAGRLIAQLLVAKEPQEPQPRPMLVRYLEQQQQQNLHQLHRQKEQHEYQDRDLHHADLAVMRRPGRAITLPPPPPPLDRRASTVSPSAHPMWARRLFEPRRTQSAMSEPLRSQTLSPPSASPASPPEATRDRVNGEPRLPRRITAPARSFLRATFSIRKRTQSNNSASQSDPQPLPLSASSSSLTSVAVNLTNASIWSRSSKPIHSVRGNAELYLDPYDVLGGSGLCGMDLYNDVSADHCDQVGSGPSSVGAVASLPVCDQQPLRRRSTSHQHSPLQCYEAGAGCGLSPQTKLLSALETPSIAAIAEQHPIHSGASCPMQSILQPHGHDAVLAPFPERVEDSKSSVMPIRRSASPPSSTGALIVVHSAEASPRLRPDMRLSQSPPFAPISPHNILLNYPVSEASTQQHFLSPAPSYASHRRGGSTNIAMHLDKASVRAASLSFPMLAPPLQYLSSSSTSSANSPRLMHRHAHSPRSNTTPSPLWPISDAKITNSPSIGSISTLSFDSLSDKSATCHTLHEASSDADSILGMYVDKVYPQANYYGYSVVNSNKVSSKAKIRSEQNRYDKWTSMSSSKRLSSRSPAAAQPKGTATGQIQNASIRSTALLAAFSTAVSSLITTQPKNKSRYKHVSSLDVHTGDNHAVATKEAHETSIQRLDHHFLDHPKFASRVAKGIPHSWRGDVWFEMITRLSKSHMATNRGPGSLEEAAGVLSVPLSKYRQYKNRGSAYDEEIRLDVQKTMRYHVYFDSGDGPSTKSLERILRTLALLAPDVGYEKSMTLWVALLLTVTDHETAFLMAWCLLQQPPSILSMAPKPTAPASAAPLIPFSTFYGMHGVYARRRRTLPECVFVHGVMLDTYTPKAAARLKLLGISPEEYLPTWISTVFNACFNPPLINHKAFNASSDTYQRWTGLVSFATILRIWDLYALYGYDFLFAVSVAIIRTYESALLVMDPHIMCAFLRAEMESPDLMRVSKSLPKQPDPDVFIRTCLSIWDTARVRVPREIRSSDDYAIESRGNHSRVSAIYGCNIGSSSNRPAVHSLNGTTASGSLYQQSVYAGSDLSFVTNQARNPWQHIRSNSGPTIVSGVSLGMTNDVTTPQAYARNRYSQVSSHSAGRPASSALVISPKLKYAGRELISNLRAIHAQVV